MAIGPGSIAFVGINTGGGADEDWLAFVALENIAAGTTIYFSDNELLSGSAASFNAGESYTKWVAPAVGIQAGSIVKITHWDTAASLAATSGTASAVTVASSTNRGFSQGADSVYAYLAASDASAATPLTHLARINIGNVEDGVVPDALGPTQRISFLSGAEHAVYVGPRAGETSFAGFLDDINNPANWTTGTGATASAVSPTDFAVAGGSETQSVAFASGSLDVAVPEGNAGTKTVSFTIERTGGTQGDVQFSGTLAPGATNGSDFVGGDVPTSFSGSIPAGANSVTVTIVIAGDTVVEGDETFTLTLDSATNASASVTTTLGSATVAQGTILNDDVPSSNVTINGITILDQAESLQGSVTTPVATESLDVTRKGQWLSGDGAGGAESISFDPGSDRAFVTNAADDTIDILDMSNPFAPTKFGEIDLSVLPGYGEVNSVAVKNGIVAVAVQNRDGGEPGLVALYDVSGTFLKSITVGVLPDQLTFSPDGNLLLVANEAEAFNDTVSGTIDNASGSVTIIDISGGAATAQVRNTVGFTALDGAEAALDLLGIKIFAGNGNLPAPTASQDIEPESITVSPDGTKAYVTLQEVNAVAVIDLTDTGANKPISILPLGAVDFSLLGNEGDFSDRDGAGNTPSISVGNSPVFGLLQPDAIVSFQIGGETYFITANEGDSRIISGGPEGLNEARASALGATDADHARLTVDTTWTEAGGDLYAFGGRGFSIFKQEANGSIIKVEETGGDFEQILASLPNASTVFNGQNGGEFDTRSDNKAAEPEGVDIAVVDGKTYAFVGLERAGGLMVWDVSTPTDAKFVTYIAPTSNDYGPEVIKVVSAADSPTGRAFVMTANEVSGSVTIYDLEDSSVSKISAVQGSGAASTKVGQTVTVEAIVVGDFQNADSDGGRNLGGFWLQEESYDQDGNLLTSEGIFVAQGSLGTDVQIGDRVRVTGTVAEAFGNTEINATNIVVTQADAVTDIDTMAVDIDLGANGVQGSGGVYTANLEAYEGMLVRIPETLTITEQFNLDRFGETRLTAGARPESYTMNNEASVSGYDAHLRDIASSSIILDDGRSTSNPNLDNVLTDGEYTTANAPRMGDTVTGLTGVLDFDFSQFRIHAVESGVGVNDFVSANPRTAAPADVGGTIQVASFNVLNYFTTLNNGSGTVNGQAPRGAETTAEFARQTEKLVNVIATLDADVLGLMELQNNFIPGSPGNAIEYLVAQLNAKLGAGTYAWVNPGQSVVGGDAIAVGFIYKPAVVQIANGTQVAILDDSDLSQSFIQQSTIDHVFNGANTSRAAVAVTFEEVGTGGEFTAVVNHFKSKGDGDNVATGADNDILDGNGAWNQQRTLAAEALRDWMATNPTGSQDADVMILGDLNAYNKEDPIDVLVNAGYTDQGADGYGYVFDGQTGSLDHILTNGSLSTQVTGVTEWHINADEADAIDYELNLSGAANSATERDPDIFDGDVPARVSDHDPIVVGIDLTEAPPAANFKLQILHASDFEAGLDAVDRAGNFAAIVDYLEETQTNSITLSSGDNFLPSPFFNAGSDASLKEVYETALEDYYNLAPGSLNITPGFGTADISMLNIIGVQASAIGNHEFDAGTNPFAAIIRQTATFPGAQFPYLSANLDFSADVNLSGLYTNVIQGAENYTGFPPAAGIGKKIAPATIITENGEKIGVVGATTQIVESISSTGGVEVIGADVDDMVALAAILQPTIDALLAQGINKIIVVSHLQQLALEKALAPLLHGVDIIVAGGSHTLLADSEDVGRGLHPGDTAVATYPFVTQNADGKSTVIVNTDGEYSYVGRLVVEFDANGDIVANSIDPNVSGAFATTDDVVDDLYANVIDVDHDGDIDANDADPFASGSRGDLVNDIAQGVGAIIDAQDGNIFGKTEVYLEGRRGEVRTEETNLGDLTADANLWYAQKADQTVLVSIKNGGGLRDSIGSVEAHGGTSTELPPSANPGVGKEEGEVSQLDIANSLRFNNALSLVTVTAEQMLLVLEHAVRATTATATPGQFAQIGGIAYSFDKDLPAGQRVLSAALIDEDGNPYMALVENGELVVDPSMAMRVVTLNFLLTGGDGYPFNTFIAANPAFANVVNLAAASVPDAGQVANFAAEGTEQDAFAEYMAEFYSENAYAQADTDRTQDTRIQNLDFRSDTILTAESVNQSGGAGDDVLTGALADDSLSGNGGNDRLYGYDGDDLLRGGGNNDLLDGGAGDDTLLGGSGVDQLLGGADDDLLEGGRDNDLLTGGTGSDEYSYEAGDGSDTIVEGTGSAGDADSLVFQDIDSTDVTFQKHGNDVEIVLADGSVITLKDQLTTGGVESIAFADGDTLNEAEIADALVNRGPVVSGEVLASVAEDAPSFLVSFETLLANDSDADLDALSITALADVVGGTAVIEGTNVRFTPTVNFNGAASFSYTVSDGQGGNTPATASFAITSVNDVPTVTTPVSVTTAEETTITGQIVASDIDGDALTYVVKQGFAPQHGEVMLGADGSWTYVPAANYSGQDSFTVLVNDGSGPVEAVVNLNVTPTNDGPAASSEVLASVAEDAPSFLVSFETLLANDTDADLDALSITALADIVGGTAVIEGTHVRFTPTANYHGPASFAYTVSDTAGSTSVATASFTVTSVEDVPVVVTSAPATTAEDTPVSGQIVASDADGDVLTFAVKNGAGPANGGITIDAAGNWTYTPEHNYNGQDSFTVVVSDGDDLVETVVNLSVTPANDAPMAVNDTGTAGENETKLFDVLANDSDVDGGALSLSGFSVTGVSGIALNNAQAQAAFSIDNGKLAFDGGDLFDDLENGDTASVTVSYTVQDAQGASSTADFVLTVTGADEANIIVGNGNANVLFGTNGVDIIDARGGGDYVFGRGGSDVIDAGNGADFVFGGAGHDTIDGGAGRDTLFGDAGNDVISGGEGNDMLYGGAGNDTFVFHRGEGRDVVFDFHAGAGSVDVIELDADMFADFTALMQAGAVTDTALGAQVSYDDGSSLTLVGINKANLTIDDFRFA